MTIRKKYFLLSFLLIVLGMFFLAIAFVIPFGGISLLIPIAAAALCGFMAFIAFGAALSPNPNQTAEDSLMDLFFNLFV